ncbi:MAG: VIT1/CCC1 transporter family protein [Candidatus Nanopelagicales bacterium]|nr:VIT1/CCC1 transporter family protein [Candidatus Nanopelagicales bacterium]
MKKDPRRFLAYLSAERNASLLYRSLASTVDGERREALIELADIEDKHAAHWIEKLTEYGIDIPPAPTALDPEDKALVARAQSMGLASVLTTLEENEGADAGMYDEEPEALASMPTDEREHAEVFRRMLTSSSTEPSYRTADHRQASTDNGGVEPWHKVDKSGSVRAAVFGISDGLVSNTALVMGFAGASLAGSLDNSAVLFAGLAGLLAGAFSMAAGEYVSVASQRDLFAREIEMEARELREKPEEEQKELELIYRAKGLPKADAERVAAQIMSDPKTALDTLAREELGLDPDELGNPVKVAISSFLAFAIGASVAVIPYALFSGTIAFVTAIAAAVIALCVVGGLVGKYSGRGIVFSAMRQLLWGAGAAGVTYLVGSIIGVNVS